MSSSPRREPGVYAYDAVADNEGIPLVRIESGAVEFVIPVRVAGQAAVLRATLGEKGIEIYCSEGRLVVLPSSTNTAHVEVWDWPR